MNDSREDIGNNQRSSDFDKVRHFVKNTMRGGLIPSASWSVQLEQGPLKSVPKGVVGEHSKTSHVYKKRVIRDSNLQVSEAWYVMVKRENVCVEHHWE